MRTHCADPRGTPSVTPSPSVTGPKTRCPSSSSAMRSAASCDSVTSSPMVRRSHPPRVRLTPRWMCTRAPMRAPSARSTIAWNCVPSSSHHGMELTDCCTSQWRRWNGPQTGARMGVYRPMSDRLPRTANITATGVHASISRKAAGGARKTDGTSPTRFTIMGSTVNAPIHSTTDATRSERSSESTCSIVARTTERRVRAGRRAGALVARDRARAASAATVRDSYTSRTSSAGDRILSRSFVRPPRRHSANRHRGR